MIVWAFLFFGIVLVAILAAVAFGVAAWKAWRRSHRRLAALLAPAPLVIVAVLTAWILGALELGGPSSPRGDAVGESAARERFTSHVHAILWWCYLVPALLLGATAQLSSRRDRSSRTRAATRCAEQSSNASRADG